jgi:protein-S-isoprenylcysteine O-methyltransferase Ste14
MFPLLVWIYVRLAYGEEEELLAVFEVKYARYAASTPGFFPKLRRLRSLYLCALRGVLPEDR